MWQSESTPHSAQGGRPVMSHVTATPCITLANFLFSLLRFHWRAPRRAARLRARLRMQHADAARPPRAARRPGAPSDRMCRARVALMPTGVGMLERYATFSLSYLCARASHRAVRVHTVHALHPQKTEWATHSDRVQERGGLLSGAWAQRTSAALTRAPAAIQLARGPPLWRRAPLRASGPPTWS